MVVIEAYAIAFFLLTLTLRIIPVGIAYAVSGGGPRRKFNLCPPDLRFLGLAGGSAPIQADWPYVRGSATLCACNIPPMTSVA
jgi:hypothetical protein